MKKHSIGLILIIILIACNMRAPFTGVGALTSLIQADLGLSNTLTGLLTTIPMLVFALISLLAPAVSRRIGLGRSILLSMILVLIGELIRSFTGTAGLFLGTGILCVGIGLDNVLLVSVIKQWFPDDPALPTSAYSTTMAVTSAVSIGSSVFVAQELGAGWRGALAMWLLFAVLGLVFWAPMSRRDGLHRSSEAAAEPITGPLLRSPRMWILAIYFGCQCLLFYCMTAWGPTITQAKGFTLEQSSAAATFFQLISLPITMAAPLLAERFSPKKIFLILGGCLLAGGILFFFAVRPVFIYIALLLFAQGMGCSFSFCLLFFSKMGRNPAETAAISGIAQCGGYILSAVGPVLMGALADLTGAWTWSILFLILIIIITYISGVLSSREGTIL